MAKEVTALVKLQCPGGQATPAPPVGPALGQHGINIGQFVKQFNDDTKSQQVREIAELKVKDLNSNDIEGAMRMVEGTARSCGIEVAD